MLIRRSAAAVVGQKHIWLPNIVKKHWSRRLPGNTMAAVRVPQPYDYFLLLDFEATCERNRQIKPQEIIEFPCLKVNSKSFLCESVFHQYVQPRIYNQLSTFCTELTGIIQCMVDGQPHLDGTLQLFESWMRSERLVGTNAKSIFVTCGDWDLNVIFPNQCEYFSYVKPEYMKTWINIKRSFSDATGIWPKGIIEMLRYFNLPHEGRLHSGIDDCKNMVEIMKALAEQKAYTFQANGHRP